MNLPVTISLIDESMGLPQYQTSGAVSFDLYAREDVTIEPNSFALVPNNIIVDIPEGYMLGVFSRSSTPRKKGLIIGNSVGVIDQDYRGHDDEIMTLVYNVTDAPVVVEKGERISQASLIRVGVAEFTLTPREDRKKSRGGFGSTG